MLAQIITENGQKKIIPLTADAGAGNPVGSLISMYKKSNPSGYLYCDGSTFDETKYPLLYAYLGSNVLPDYREFVLVGAEQNTTDVYNASTNPTGTIHDHDVYTQGQAKDDQLQSHAHYLKSQGVEVKSSKAGGTTYGYTLQAGNTGSDSIFADSIFVGRKGTVTRGKRKAVFFYIKATSGLSENAQDNVVAQLNEQRSYSTEEHLTGAKWIDGKPIYRKVFKLTAKLNDGESLRIPYCKSVIQCYGNYVAPWGGTNTHLFPAYQGNTYFAFDGLIHADANRDLQLTAKFNGNASFIDTGSEIVVEYTKTTD
jgi:hypothetical protein